jgi:hypothetical protein
VFTPSPRPGRELQFGKAADGVAEAAVDTPPGKRVRMYSLVLSGGSLTAPGPLRTKKSPSGVASNPFHFGNTGSGLRWQGVLNCFVAIDPHNGEYGARRRLLSSPIPACEGSDESDE